MKVQHIVSEEPTRKKNFHWFPADCPKKRGEKKKKRKKIKDLPAYS